MTGKPGVGIYVDAGEPVAAKSMEIRTPTPGWSVEIYGANDPIPETREEWSPIAEADDVSSTETIDLPTVGQKYQYYLVWVTSPVETDTGFGVSISDIRLYD